MKNPQRKLRKQFHLQEHQKNKVPRNKFFKEVKDLCTGNCKTLLKEIQKDTSKWEDIPWSWIERLNIVMMSVLPK